MKRRRKKSTGMTESEGESRKDTKRKWEENDKALKSYKNKIKRI